VILGKSRITRRAGGGVAGSRLRCCRFARHRRGRARVFGGGSRKRYVWFYDGRRSHLGNRTRGRPPAGFLWGVSWMEGDHLGADARREDTLLMSDSLKPTLMPESAMGHKMI